MFGITKNTLEHSAVPRLNEHPETNIKMAGGGGGGGGGLFRLHPTQIFSGKITFLQVTV